MILPPCPGCDINLWKSVDERDRHVTACIKVMRDQVIEAFVLLNVWLNPMKLPCKKPAHNKSGIRDCTCRLIERDRRTRDLLKGGTQ